MSRRKWNVILVASLALGIGTNCESPDIHLFAKTGLGGGGGQGGGSGLGGGTTATRDALLWPFDSSSIWNMPIGSGAEYSPVKLAAASDTPYASVDVIVVQTPSAPLTPVYYNPNGYTAGADRCAIGGELLFSAPIPADFTAENTAAGTPNREASFLLSDQRTIVQTEPFYRCQGQDHGTAFIPGLEGSLYGDGRVGPTGGSGLSSLGGTLRLGELRPSSGHVRHALRVHLDGKTNLWNCSAPDECYRWPATTSNSHAVDAFGGTNSALKTGSLLALPGALDLDSLALETPPAKELAWTLQHFGAYVVNDAGWSTRSLGTELSPDGRFVDQFLGDYGINLDSIAFDTPFARDLERLFSAVSVVNNNVPSTPGGPGNRLTAMAPPLEMP